MELEAMNSSEVSRQDVLQAVFGCIPADDPEAFMKYYNRTLHEAQFASHVDAIHAITRVTSSPDSLVGESDVVAAKILTMHTGIGEKESVKSSIERCHPQCCEEDNVALERSFDARSLEKIGRFNIIWAEDLRDHLRISDGKNGRSVRIFHHAAYLRNARKELFPESFLEETLTTLAVLFPHGDSAVRIWFDKQVSKEEFVLDRSILLCGRLKDEDRKINNFSFWRDRLAALKQSYDGQEPSNFKLWWYDRRKQAQWWTFWTAIVVLVLTIFFGVLQSIEGALQVWLAWKALALQEQSMSA